MIRRRRIASLVLLVTGAMPLLTAGTCYNTRTGFGYDLYSTNDDLVDDVLELFSDEDDDD